MKSIVTKTFRVLGRVYESLIPDEATARKIGAQYINRYKANENLW